MDSKKKKKIRIQTRKSLSRRKMLFLAEEAPNLGAGKYRRGGMTAGFPALLLFP